MMRSIALGGCLLMTCLTALAGAADFAVQVYQPSAGAAAFDTALDTTRIYTAQLSLARAFRDRYPDDADLQIRVAAFLAMDNLDSARAYYRARAEQESANPVALYLAGRVMESPAEQRHYAERILAKDADDYWGNLLLAGASTPETDPSLNAAEAALRKAIRRNNSLPYAVEQLGHLLRLRSDMAGADAVFLKLSQMQPGRFQPVQLRLMLTAGDHAKAIRLIDEFVSKNPHNVDALYAKARAQRELGDWPGHLGTMRKVVREEYQGENAYNLACGFALAGEKDSAFTWLFTAARMGFCDLEQYKSDDDLIPLRDDARWSELLDSAESAEKVKMMEAMRKAAETALQRKQEALQTRLNAPAPDFDVKDLNGKSVKLSTLRGKVVILDFWATWCGPCKKTMPLLDQFYTQSRPAEVEVFGMNVWERGGTDRVKPFIEERKIHFPILYGSNEIADAYGVRGIPTLVVIDQDGKIAYRHVGFDPMLPETLIWQTKELLK